MSRARKTLICGMWRCTGSEIKDVSRILYTNIKGRVIRDKKVEPICLNE